ncbi:MAG: major capsid protein [Microviridae sp.]|nr:MAG: major capsid protein [Microviridae sp.]
MKFFDEQIKIKNVKKSKFDLSHEVKLSCNMGELIPVLVEDVMPGDSYRCNTEVFARLAPMIAPLMHRVNFYIHTFAVPMRLLMPGGEWERLIAGNQTGDNRPAPVIPQIQLGVAANIDYCKAGKLLDYLGIPTTESSAFAPNPIEVSSLPIHAYHLIYDEYYRDQDLELAGRHKSELDVFYNTRKRAWEKDYFTSARPFAQKGGAVTIPFEYSPISEVYNESGGPAPVNTLVGTNGADGSQMMVGKTDFQTGGTLGRIENIEALASINEFREANALQRFLEKLARSGNRYVEYIKMIFNKKSPDARLQRPEYLGGGRIPVVISEVLSTYDNTTGGLPQGNMSGHGLAVGNTSTWSKEFDEHCYVISLLSILPRTGYQQGVRKHWFRKDQLDWPIPDFAHLGEQEVKNKELYYDYTEADPNIAEQTFGYQSRYSECKFRNSTSHGDFKTSLLFYHMDRVFSSRPALNKEFVQSDPTTRIFAIVDPDVHHVWINMHHSMSAIRPLPYNGIPTL